MTEPHGLDDGATVEGDPTARAAITPASPAMPRRRSHVVRRRTVTVAALAAVAILVGVGLVWLGAHTVANSTEGRVTQRPTTPLRRLPATPAALLVGTDREGQAVSLTLLGLNPDGKGGHVVVLPAGAAVDIVQGEGAPVRLGSGFASGGIDGQEVLVESFLGITITAALAADEGQLAQLLAAVTPVTVSLDEPVIDTDAKGTPVTLFPAGSVTLDGAGAARFLIARENGRSEIDRLDRERRFWEAVFARPPAGSTTGTPSDVAGFVNALRAGPVQTHSLPVTLVLDSARNPDHGDLLDVDGTTVRLLMARSLPGAVSPADAELRCWIINPTGDPDLSYRAVGALVYLHVDVMLVTESSSTVPDRTRIAYGTPSGQRAVYLAGLFGRGELVPTDEPVDGIDVTITLGRDFASAPASSLPPSTTGTTAAGG